MNKECMISSIKIGQVLKRILNERRATLKEISEETDIPYSTLHTWLENRQPKDIIKAQKLAHYFSISLEELLFDHPGVKKHKSEDGIPEGSLKLVEGHFEVIIRKKG